MRPIYKNLILGFALMDTNTLYYVGLYFILNICSRSPIGFVYKLKNHLAKFYWI